jgi:hypothetical protein
MKGERGSTLPLAIGLAVLVLLTALTEGEVQGLIVERARAQAEARFAALYIAKQMAGVPPIIDFDYGPIVRKELPLPLELKVWTEDGKTYEARVCLAWKPLFGIAGPSEVCDCAKARVIA